MFAAQMRAELMGPAPQQKGQKKYVDEDEDEDYEDYDDESGQSYDPEHPPKD